MKKIISKTQQEYFTKICKYCNGTGKDVFNKEEDCPNCVKPYLIQLFKEDLVELENEKILRDTVNDAIEN